jgi:hypothetical protein
MPRNRDDDFDDIGADEPGGESRRNSDLDSLDEYGFISSEMTDEFARFIGDRWREAHDSKPISASISLSAALNKSPAQWIDAACAALRVSPRGSDKRTRRAKIEALIAALSRPEDLTRCVLDMPPYARAALRRVIDNGGSIRLSTLTRDFGDMTGDGWFWNEQPPTSSLGELRRRALLFVGRGAAPRSAKAARRPGKIAVVPTELREALAGILSDAAVRREEEQALAQYFASPDELLKEALDTARAHYETAEWSPHVRRDDINGFLRECAGAGLNPLLVWTSLETVLEFFDHNAHEIRGLEDLAGYHLSELSTEFVDQHFLLRWSLDERRELIETVRRLYVYLHRNGRINSEALEEIEQASKQLTSGRRKLNLIRRPPALGGELILTRLNPNSGAEERYTVNHQRLIMVWWDEFHQDWRTLLERCAGVPDGASKAQLVHDLIGLEPAVCELLIARADDEDIDASIHWFYEETVLMLSAW